MPDSPQYSEDDQINIVRTQKNFEDAMNLLSSRDYQNYKTMALHVFEKEDQRRDAEACERMAKSLQPCTVSELSEALAKGLAAAGDNLSNEAVTKNGQS